MHETADELKPGTALDHYVIEYTLSRGGFSIVYLAQVTGLQKRVAIKEYMPGKLACRVDDLMVAPRNEDDVDRFRHGRKLFFKEASTLATLKHPNIVNVFNFFGANGTAYMVMEYEPGQNLQDYVQKYRGNLSEKFLRTVFPALLAGLREVHAHRLLHLDIKPANVHLRPGGDPLLLDFGAVHQMLESRRQHKAQVITPGYSPIEQYDNSRYVGPWTDIYAVGATMRTCLDGAPPPSAEARLDKDTLRPAVDAFRRKYSAELLSAIDWAMAVDPLERPQDVDDLLETVGSAPAEDGEDVSEPMRTPSLWSKK